MQSITFPAAASATAGHLLDLLIILVAAKVGEEIFKRLGQPGLVGEILGGLIAGPAVFGWVEPNEVIDVFAELGVVFLLFWVGLETRLADMRAVGARAAAVGGAGFVVPLVAGVGFGLMIGESIESSLFLAAALVATSVAVTSAVLMEQGRLQSAPARTILGAAVVDDILAMILLAIVVGVASGGQVDVVALLLTIAMALGFVAFVAFGGTRVTARWPQVLEAPKFSESPLLPAVIVCLALAVLAAEIGLALIIGAFLAGMVVAETKEHTPIEQEIAPINAFFAPFFFGSIGLVISLDALRSWESVGLLAAVVVLAFVTKFLGAWVGARTLGPRAATFVGVGMIPRGEVGIVVAGIGRQAEVIGDRLFSIIVLMSVVTTLVVPPLLRRMQLDDDQLPGAGSADGAIGL